MRVPILAAGDRHAPVSPAHRLAITTACLPLAVLLPMAAYASFSAAPCSSVACHFQALGVLLGVLGGLPISGAIFMGLHAFFAHPARSRVRQAVLGGLFGLLAYELAAAAGACHAVWRHPPGYRGGSPWAAFIVVYLLLAVLAGIYVRSTPATNRGHG